MRGPEKREEMTWKNGGLDLLICTLTVIALLVIAFRGTKK